MQQLVSYHVPDWKNLQRAGVQLSQETRGSRHHGAKFRDPDTPQTLHQYVIKGFKGGLSMGPSLSREASVSVDSRCHFFQSG